MSELTEEDARWQPAEDRFSIAEVLAHLSHSEGHCYRMRLDRLLSEERPEFEPDDAQMCLDLYRNVDPEDAFDHFEEQRENNLDYLRELPASAGDRRAIHKEYGEITLSQMSHEWALHDLGHIRQIAELVRARKYLGGAGPMGCEYQLRPVTTPSLARLSRLIACRSPVGRGGVVTRPSRRTTASGRHLDRCRRSSQEHSPDWIFRRCEPE
jgi:hypothetical protein